MYRFPPKRYPRVAALLETEHGTVLLVLDAWEVRAVVVSDSARELRCAVLRERPSMVVANPIPEWLRRLKVPTVEVGDEVTTPRLEDVPELRRYVGTPHEALLGHALGLADELLSRAWL